MSIFIHFIPVANDLIQHLGLTLNITAFWFFSLYCCHFLAHFTSKQNLLAPKGFHFLATVQSSVHFSNCHSLLCERFTGAASVMSYTIRANYDLKKLWRL